MLDTSEDEGNGRDNDQRLHLCKILRKLWKSFRLQFNQLEKTKRSNKIMDLLLTRAILIHMIYNMQRLFLIFS